MATDEAQRQRLIQLSMANRTGEVNDIVIQLLQPLSSQLISIIGAGGFNAIYNRSIFLTRATFPWLTAGEPLSPVDYQFPDLKASLAGPSATEASKASYMLLLTFTNILASLIGEALTIDILGSAWGSQGLEADIAGKEFPHE